MKWIWHMCMVNIRQRGIRTGLTVLGVVIGVMSIVSLLGIGIGLRSELLALTGADGNVTEIRIYGIVEGNRKDKMLTDRSLAELEEWEGVSAVYPVLSVDVMLENEGFVGYGQIMGVPREYLATMNVVHETDPEEPDGRLELLMGNQTGVFFFRNTTGQSYEELYEDEEMDWTGKRLDVTFGFQPDSPKGKLSVTNMLDDSYDIFCDIDTFKQYLKKIAGTDAVPGQPLNADGSSYQEWIYTSAIVKAEDVDAVDALVKKLQDAGYQAESNKEFVDYIEHVVQIIQIVLGGIGMIALIVSVIGIGNTMTTAVYERTREIGLLKVLGCDPEELLFLFLLEAGMLGGLGGIIGLALSYGVAELLMNKKVVAWMKLPADTTLAVIPLWLAAASVCFAVLMGVLAGMIPAKWATKLKPIDAILR